MLALFAALVNYRGTRVLFDRREKPRTWRFYRTYEDFRKLDRALRRYQPYYRIHNSILNIYI